MGLFGFGKKDLKNNTEVFCNRIKSLTKALLIREDIRESEDLKKVIYDINDNIVCVFVWRSAYQKGKIAEAYDNWLIKFLDEAESDAKSGEYVSSAIKVVCLTKLLRMTKEGYEVLERKSQNMYSIAKRLTKILQCVDIYNEGEREIKELEKKFKKVEGKLHGDYVPTYNAILHKQNEAISYIKTGTKEYNEQIKNFPDEGFFELNGAMYFTVKREFLKNAKKLAKGFTWYVPDESDKAKEIEQLLML